MSESRLDSDKIVRGYHGFTYDSTGTCVFAPRQLRVPRTAPVPSLPCGGTGFLCLGVDR
ncbi:hypothetical protein ACFFRB_38765 [Kibdelosporangium aridum subsp. largum]|uniref:hypothetical protein n=1 Tax=Kibdelosporangium aridum TaxID=2030 RepID=UPI0035EA0EA2